MNIVSTITLAKFDDGQIFQIDHNRKRVGDSITQIAWNVLQASEYADLRPVDPEVIISDICEYFQMSEADLFIRSRRRDIVYVRHFCRLFLCAKTILSLDNIAKRTGANDHSVSIHSKQSIQKLIDTEEKVEQDYLNLCKILKAFPDMIKDKRKMVVIRNLEREKIKAIYSNKSHTA